MTARLGAWFHAHPNVQIAVALIIVAVVAAALIRSHLRGEKHDRRDGDL